MDESEPTEPRVTVQHCLLVRQGMTDESWKSNSGTENGPYVLRGVGYRYRVDPPAAFPTSVKPPWAVYLRITSLGAGPTRVLFRVHYDNGGQWEHLARYEMDRTIPFPNAGENTFDVVFNLSHMRIGGAGAHALSVHFWYDGFESDASAALRADEGPPAWATDPEELFGVPDWAFGAVEYFLLEVLS